MLTYHNFFEEYNQKIELLKERTKRYFQIKANEFSVYKQKPFQIALLNSNFLSIKDKDFSGFNFLFEEEVIKFKYINIIEDYYEPDIIVEYSFDLPLWLLRDDFEDLLSDLEENINEENIKLKDLQDKANKIKVDNAEYRQYLKLKQKYEKKGE